MCAREQDELGRIEERLGKWKLPDVHRAMDLVDLPRGSGDKVRTCATRRLPSVANNLAMYVCLWMSS